MRRLFLLTAATLTITACSSEPTSPLIDIDVGMAGSELTLAGGYEAEVYQDRLVNALPDDIKLSEEQRQQIRALVSAFQQATRADREALAAILRNAREAVRAGKSRDEIQSILRTAAPIRDRLIAAERKLKADIDAVLTPEQRAWIEANSPRKCRPGDFPPLSDAQRSAIRALEAGFREANKADIEAIRVIFQEARAAAQAGKSREEIAAIIARGAPIAARLAVARRNLHEQILAVLTPAQKASGCFPLG